MAVAAHLDLLVGPPGRAAALPYGHHATITTATAQAQYLLLQLRILGLQLCDPVGQQNTLLLRDLVAGGELLNVDLVFAHPAGNGTLRLPFGPGTCNSLEPGSQPLVIGLVPPC